MLYKPEQKYFLTIKNIYNGGNYKLCLTLSIMKLGIMTLTIMGKIASLKRTLFNLYVQCRYVMPLCRV
jgi:hypothetical protein